MGDREEMKKRKNEMDNYYKLQTQKILMTDKKRGKKLN